MFCIEWFVDAILHFSATVKSFFKWKREIIWTISFFLHIEVSSLFIFVYTGFIILQATTKKQDYS